MARKIIVSSLETDIYPIEYIRQVSCQMGRLGTVTYEDVSLASRLHMYVVSPVR